MEVPTDLDGRDTEHDEEAVLSADIALGTSQAAATANALPPSVGHKRVRQEETEIPGGDGEMNTQRMKVDDITVSPGHAHEVIASEAETREMSTLSPEVPEGLYALEDDFPVGANNEDGEEAEAIDGVEQEEYIHLLLRVAELEATKQQAAEQYAFAVRMAEADEKILRGFQERHNQLRAVIENNEALHRNAALVPPERADASSSKGLQSAMATSVAQGQAQLWCLLQRAAEEAVEGHRAHTQAAVLRTHLEHAAWHNDSPQGSSLHTAQPAHMLRRMYAAAGLVVAQEANEAGGGALCPNADVSLVQSDLCEHARLQAALTDALAFVRHAPTRTALEGLLQEHLTLQKHHHDAVQIQQMLKSANDEGALQELDALCLPSQEWGLIAAQNELTVSRQCMCPSLTEQRLLARNKHLREKLAERRAALTVLMLDRISADRLQGHWKSTDALSGKCVTELKEKLHTSESLRDHLIREVLYLRKLVEERARRDGTVTPLPPWRPPLTGADMHTHGIEPPKHRRLVALSTTIALQHKATESLASLLERTVLRQHPHDCVTSARLTEQLLSLQETAASRHHSLAMLLAENTRLWQLIQDVWLVKDIVPGEASAKLAEALLRRCGALSLLEGDEENPLEEEEGARGKPEGESDEARGGLLNLQQVLLDKYRARILALQEFANKHLGDLDQQCRQPELLVRREVSHFIRLQQLADLLKMQNTYGTTAPPAACVSSLLPRLETTQHESDLVAATVEPVVLPVLPATTNVLLAPFEKLSSEKTEAVQSAWRSVSTACTTTAQEVEWYAQYSVEQAAERMEEEKARKTMLLQSMAEVGHRAKQYAADQRRLQELTARLAEVRDRKKVQLVASIAHQRGVLDKVLSDNAERRTHQERVARQEALEREAEEAERLLQVQQSPMPVAAERLVADMSVPPTPIVAIADAPEAKDEQQDKDDFTGSHPNDDFSVEEAVIENEEEAISFEADPMNSLPEPFSDDATEQGERNTPTLAAIDASRPTEAFDDSAQTFEPSYVTTEETRRETAPQTDIADDPFVSGFGFDDD